MSLSGPGRSKQNLEVDVTEAAKKLQEGFDKLAMGDPLLSLDDINTGKNEEKMAEVPFQPYKNMFTYISMNNVSIPDQGIFSAVDVSKELQKQYNLGYRVMNVQYTGTSSTGALGVFYFLKHVDA